MPARYKVTKRSGSDNYQLRYYVPRDLQAAFGKKEVVRTLRTTVKREADEIALDVVKEIALAVKTAQRPTPAADQQVLYEPADGQLEAAAREVYFSEVESDWEERNDPDHMALMGLGGKKSAKAYRKEAKKLRRAASVGDYSVADVDYWASHFGFLFPPNNIKRNRFRKLLAYAYAEAAERWAEHDIGKRGGRPQMPELRASDVALLPIPQGSESTASFKLQVDKSNMPSLVELWDSHERQRGKGVKDATLADRRVSVRLFADFVGHRKPVASITKSEARNWRELLYNFPKKASQRKELKSLGFSDIVEKGIELGHPTISARTVAKHVSGLNTYFQWLSDEGLVTENVFSGLTPVFSRSQKRAGEFSDQQLNELFNSPLFTGCAGTANIVQYATSGSVQIRDWRYWLPLCAAFSGARLGELAQLHVNDIRSSEGIHYFDINDEGGDDKSVKTGWSSRIVPIHSELQRLGFLEFVSAQRKRGQTRLFPELKRTPRGYFDGASKWFGKYFGQLKFEADTRGHCPTFHSFRHSAIERMSKELTDNEIGPLVGHEETTTTKGYRNSPTYSISKRKEHIEHIKFNGLDLNHLGKSQSN
ncbi:tyrosine-type recombinase/integrase [Sulfitobacter sp. W002]|uniref:DUF6538 domain-containing protein n=1 Tax=Sulfitobacter sp. W002 TaxID=2867024 RepID=UPI0021A8C854|nr:DUF6538 domain-containing protein [Sulfitobacter sp. W002]UWR29657.1 tyrosine-type recombinase/integrase [Sulfitobacter sp. W002]